MKYHKILALGAFLCCVGMMADDHMLSSSVDDGLTFYCSFDGSANAVKSIGSPKGVSPYKTPFQFAAGIKDRGLRIGRSSDGKVKHTVWYQGLKNINHKQGTISFWIKPEDWAPTAPDFALFVTGLKKNGTFFVYKYRGNTVRFHIKDDDKTSNSIVNNRA